MPPNYKLVQEKSSIDPEVVIEQNVSSTHPVLNKNDKFVLDSFKNFDEMRESAAKVIDGCNADSSCFEKIIMRDNPDANKVVFDNKENISIQYNVSKTYHLIHKRVVLIGVVTVNNKIIKFSVNSGIK